MSDSGDGSPPRGFTALDRALRVFADVRAGEGATALMMLFNVFVVLVAYYVIKVVREGLILSAGTAELKGSTLKMAAIGCQAALLIFAVPLYSHFAARVPTRKLIFGLTFFFIACIEVFYLWFELALPGVGFAFYVWVGTFNVAIVAQFWSFANDIHSIDKGSRLFPLIAVGATVGAPAGSFIAGKLSDAGFASSTLMQLSAALLLVHVLVYYVVLERADAAPHTPTSEPSPDGSILGGFALIFGSRYLTLIAVLLVLLNLVNTTGEYLLSVYAEDQAILAFTDAVKSGGTVSREAFIGRHVRVFFGGFFTAVNVASVLLQAFVVSRIVKYLGIAGVLLALPIVALVNYAWIGVGLGFAAFRWLKTAENATDYSLMNTAKAMLWLPTTRSQKYQAKFATDTFFVRFGDLLAAGLVLGTLGAFELSPESFAQVNVVIVLVWLAVSLALLRQRESR